MAPISPKTRLNTWAVAPNPPYSSGMLSPISPSSWSPARTASGKRAFWSIFAESIASAAKARNASRIRRSDSPSSADSSGKGKTSSSRSSPRKIPFVNDGLTSGSARCGSLPLGAS